MATTEIPATTATEAYVQPFNDIGIIVSVATIFPLCLVGTIGNIITIIVIATTPKLKSIFNYLIVSLCVSDLISAIISPLFVYRRSWGYEYWYWTNGLCKVYMALDVWTSYVTCIHILLFAMLRFISIQWPNRFNSIRNIHIKILICVIWIVTFFAGAIPATIFYGVSVRDRQSSSIDSKWPSCSINKDGIDFAKGYSKIAYPLFFYLPVLFVIAFSIGIGVKIVSMRRVRKSLQGDRKTSKETVSETKRRKKENQIIFQLALIVGSFLFGYIPLTAFHFYSLKASSSSQASVVNWWFGCIQFLLLRISECLNPVFYNLASSKMRKETNRMLKSWFSKLSCARGDDSKKQAYLQSGQTSSTKLPTSSGTRL